MIPKLAWLIAQNSHWISANGPLSPASYMHTRDLMPKGAFLGHGIVKGYGLKLIWKVFGIGPRNRIS